jgi:predicted O-methyltransferase YrrM
MGINSALRSAFDSLRQVFLYLLSAPPAFVARAFLRSLWQGRTQIRNAKRINELTEFRGFANERLQITHDWFSHNIPVWSWVFEKNLKADAELRILEIGSFEGLSTNYLLDKFPRATVRCVDTWLGSPEHKNHNNSADNIDFSQVNNRFIANTENYRNRVQTAVGTSLEFFSTLNPSELFDLVYVDGSHEADDVLVDAVLSFKHLRKGGILIFDDYLWQFFAGKSNNPGPAIESFLSLRRNDLEILHIGYQVIIRRLGY